MDSVAGAGPSGVYTVTSFTYLQYIQQLQIKLDLPQFPQGDYISHREDILGRYSSPAGG